MTDTSSSTCKCGIIHDDVVKRLLSIMPEPGDFDDLAALYKVFSDPSRVKILWAVARQEMCVCDIGSMLDMSMAAISHHLKILRLSNLVKFRKDGKVVYYRLADNHVKEILDCGFEHIHE